MRFRQERLEQEMRSGQERMEQVQKEMNLILAGKEEIRAHVESQVKDHVNRCVEKMEDDVQGSAAEVPQGIPADKLTNLTTIEKALESRFGDSHFTQFYRTELKTRRQKQGESLQALAADVERLMNLVYAECPLDVWESLAAQYFVDAIRDEDT
ncbi:hypothetical protein AVEN_194637-1 [Araneus ventricosus]|uniref:Uncharacterized protein n=1 Tax=Araneus ventricosus TaxID=182803 RepID=A0A4Y2A702_ARAVE|nr:hypothetical protein AVEN_194637-1 [Araneus ventricosus]